MKTKQFPCIIKNSGYVQHLTLDEIAYYRTQKAQVMLLTFDMRVKSLTA